MIGERIDGEGGGDDGLIIRENAVVVNGSPVVKTMIQLSASGVVKWPAPRRLAGLRRAFARDHFVRLPALLEPGLLARVMTALDATRFAPKERSGVISMEGSRNHEADFLLTFCLQHPRFFELIEAVTGSPSIRSFAGRLIRMRPGSSHFLDWHSDASFDPQRLASISVNLGREPYRGGLLQFRAAGSTRVLSEISNTGCGDAVLFPAYGEVLHRNTPVLGSRPKTAFSGWFYADRKGRDAMFCRPPLVRK